MRELQKEAMHTQGCYGIGVGQQFSSLLPSKGRVLEE